ncbi:MAG TPA: DUF2490 domain-containing protein [bacterium]
MSRFGLACVLVLGSLAVTPAVRASDDWHLWQETVWPLFTRGRVSGTLVEQTRYRDDMREIFFVYWEGSAAVQVLPHLRAGAVYSYMQEKGQDGHWRDEHRPMFDLIPHVAVGPVKFENRARLEIRVIEGASDDVKWRYRNRIQAVYTLPGTDGRLAVCASEEPFFETPHGGWNQNRLFAGLQTSLTKQLSATLAWGIQSIRRGADWDDRQLLLLSGKIRL